MSYRHRQTILIPRLTPEEFQALRGCCFVLVGALSASMAPRNNSATLTLTETGRIR